MSSDAPDAPYVRFTDDTVSPSAGPAVTRRSAAASAAPIFSTPLTPASAAPGSPVAPPARDKAEDPPYFDIACIVMNDAMHSRRVDPFLALCPEVTSRRHVWLYRLFHMSYWKNVVVVACACHILLSFIEYPFLALSDGAFYGLAPQVCIYIEVAFITLYMLDLLLNITIQSGPRFLFGPPPPVLAAAARTAAASRAATARRAAAAAAAAAAATSASATAASDTAAVDSSSLAALLSPASAAPVPPRTPHTPSSTSLLSPAAAAAAAALPYVPDFRIRRRFPRALEFDSQPPELPLPCVRPPRWAAALVKFGRDHAGTGRPLQQQQQRARTQQQQQQQQYVPPHLHQQQSLPPSSSLPTSSSSLLQPSDGDDSTSAALASDPASAAKPAAGRFDDGLWSVVWVLPVRPWLLVRMLCIFGLILDLGLYARAVLSAPVPAPLPGERYDFAYDRYFRFSRPLRLLFLISRRRRLRTVVTAFGRTMVAISHRLLLNLFVLCFFAFFGFLLYASSDELPHPAPGPLFGYTFETLWNALYFMFVGHIAPARLMIILSPYATSTLWTPVYMTTFFFFFNVFFLSVITALAYRSYRASVKEDAERRVSIRRDGIALAYTLLARLAALHRRRSGLPPLLLPSQQPPRTPGGGRGGGGGGSSMGHTVSTGYTSGGAASERVSVEITVAFLQHLAPKLTHAGAITLLNEIDPDLGTALTTTAAAPAPTGVATDPCAVVSVTLSTFKLACRLCSEATVEVVGPAARDGAEGDGSGSDSDDERELELDGRVYGASRFQQQQQQQQQQQAASLYRTDSGDGALPSLPPGWEGRVALTTIAHSPAQGSGSVAGLRLSVNGDGMSNPPTTATALAPAPAAAVAVTIAAHGHNHLHNNNRIHRQRHWLSRARRRVRRWLQLRVSTTDLMRCRCFARGRGRRAAGPDATGGSNCRTDGSSRSRSSSSSRSKGATYSDDRRSILLAPEGLIAERAANPALGPPTPGEIAADAAARAGATVLVADLVVVPFIILLCFQLYNYALFTQHRVRRGLPAFDAVAYDATPWGVIALVLRGLFIIECVVKVWAFGPRAFWARGINRVDAIVTAVSTVGTIVSHASIGVAPLTFVIAIRSIRALRLLSLTAPAIRIFKTIGRVFPALGGIIFVFLSLIFAWALFAVDFIGGPQLDPDVNPALAVDLANEWRPHRHALSFASLPHTVLTAAIIALANWWTMLIGPVSVIRGWRGEALIIVFRTLMCLVFLPVFMGFVMEAVMSNVTIIEQEEDEKRAAAAAAAKTAAEAADAAARAAARTAARAAALGYRPGSTFIDRGSVPSAPSIATAAGAPTFTTAAAAGPGDDGLWQSQLQQQYLQQRGGAGRQSVLAAAVAAAGAAEAAEAAHTAADARARAVSRAQANALAAAARGEVLSRVYPPPVLSGDTPLSLSGSVSGTAIGLGSTGAGGASEDGDDDDARSYAGSSGYTPASLRRAPAKSALTALASAPVAWADDATGTDTVGVTAVDAAASAFAFASMPSASLPSQQAPHWQQQQQQDQPHPQYHQQTQQPALQRPASGMASLAGSDASSGTGVPPVTMGTVTGGSSLAYGSTVAAAAAAAAAAAGAASGASPPVQGGFFSAATSGAPSPYSGGTPYTGAPDSGERPPAAGMVRAASLYTLTSASGGANGAGGRGGAGRPPRATRVRVVPRDSTEYVIERNALKVEDAEKEAIWALGRGRQVNPAAAAAAAAAAEAAVVQSQTPKPSGSPAHGDDGDDVDVDEDDEDYDYDILNPL